MRIKLEAVGLFFLLLFSNSCYVAAEERPRTEANVPIEIVLAAKQVHDDPFNTVTLDVLFTDPSGAVRRVPAFWDGGAVWKARYASPLAGIHRWRGECNDVKDTGLHGAAGEWEVVPYTGDNPLFKHGQIRVAADKRHFEHADGTPFFWLGDTWWMGLCHRLKWPDEFKKLTADRKEKGFTVVQIVAGLYPDMHPFDPRGANESGFPWEKEYARIRPEYFDAADIRLRHLVDQGITPCIVGAWGYFLPWMGVEKAKMHWRYLIARYSAWPVVWCVAGEANLPWYLAKGFPYDDRELIHGWTEVARSIRASDPFHRLLTIHPTGIGPLNARHAIDDTALLDFDMLQTPHGQREAVAPTLKAVKNSFEARPMLPVLNGECSYEMLMDQIPAQWPRAMFWLCMLNGAAGHTYGANGIWQCNRRGEPHGKSPHGGFYGVIPWDDAMNLPGSKQLGFGKKFLEEFSWQQLSPAPESVAWAARADGTAPWGNWIWFPEGDPKRDAPVGPCFFRRVFELPPNVKIKTAVLHISADDAYTVWLNGTEIGAGKDWKTPGNFNVEKALNGGRNVFAVRAENLAAPVKENPAGLIATMTIDMDDHAAEVVSTDAVWRASKSESSGWLDAGFDDSAWQHAMVAAKYGDAPWGRFDENKAESFPPFAAGIEDRLRIVYAMESKPLLLRGLRAGEVYRLTYFDPVMGEKSVPIEVKPDDKGEWRCQAPGYNHDWVVVLLGP